MYSIIKNSTYKSLNTINLYSCASKLLLNKNHNLSLNKNPDHLNNISNVNININPPLKKDILNKTTNVQLKKQVNLKVEKQKKPGIVFDIDGVLVKGKRILPETIQTFQLLESLKIPFIFLTNGGGIPEKQKALELSRKFNITIKEEQIVLGHSPMKSVAEKFKNDIVLIIGSDTCKNVAYSYGFKKPILTKEIVSWRPSIWPFEGQIVSKCPYDLDNEPIKAVLMFNDSPTWGRDIQIACDVLRSANGKLGTIQQPFVQQAVPCYFAAADLLWSNDFPLSRFGQGAFKLAFDSLFKELTGKNLESVQFGKPEKTTYDYSKKMLEEVSKNYFHQQISNIYAIGDNPSVDIRG